MPFIVKFLNEVLIHRVDIGDDHYIAALAGVSLCAETGVFVAEHRAF